MDDLGLLVKNLRKAAGLSQGLLALRHGMGRATLSGIENNTLPDKFLVVKRFDTAMIL